MKTLSKIILIIITLSLLVSLVACNAEDTNDQNFVTLDEETVEKEQIAHVIFLCGQSNASGYTWLNYLESNSTEEEWADYNKGYSNVYINVYNEGNKNTNDCFVQTKAGLGTDTKHFGPELGLARYLNKNYPNETFYIIKRAWGGTSLETQWLKLEDGSRNTLYDQFKTFADDSLNVLTRAGIKYQVEAFLWMQGENDSCSETSTANYYLNTTRLASYVREDFASKAAADGIYFIDAGISTAWPRYTEVNASKKQFASESKLNIYFATSENGLTYNTEPKDAIDVAHYDSLSEIKLGELFAKTYETACLIK